jgi:hypothetical protein
MSLDASVASGFARVALANVVRSHPHKVDHLIVGGPESAVPDHVAAHPVFFGAYDWHSAVHMHWLLVRVLRLQPATAEAAAVVSLLDRQLTMPALAAELRYLESPAGRTFERPYGWAWLLELRAELERLAGVDRRAVEWAAAVDPLARVLAERLASFLASAVYPIRAGTHANTAFACLLAHDYATVCRDAHLARAVVAAIGRWYAADRDAPIAYEPSLTDFLSPCLAEAAAMRLAADEVAYVTWHDRFLPDGPGPLSAPPVVADRHDPQIAHLDGLSLSRAWMMTRIADGLPAGHARQDELRQAAARHLAAGLPWTVGGDYVGEHWLASFAALALGDVP